MINEKINHKNKQMIQIINNNNDNDNEEEIE